MGAWVEGGGGRGGRVAGRIPTFRVGGVEWQIRPPLSGDPAEDVGRVAGGRVVEERAASEHLSDRSAERDERAHHVQVVSSSRKKERRPAVLRQRAGLLPATLHQQLYQTFTQHALARPQGS